MNGRGAGALRRDDALCPGPLARVAGRHLDRRSVLVAGCAALMVRTSAPARAAAACTSLPTCPIAIEGEFPTASGAVHTVAEAIRHACFAGLAICPSEQPAVIAIRNSPTSTPAIWLQTADPTRAVIIVNIGEAAWSQFGYQLGHELGHVLCNSWKWGQRPLLPSQWIEESLAEAFALVALARLATNWSESPPFPGDAAYGRAIAAYRDDLVAEYRRRAAAVSLQDREALAGGSKKLSETLVLALMTAMLQAPETRADLGALNLWPERGAVSPPRFAEEWRASCKRGATPCVLPGELARWLRQSGWP